MTNTQENSSNFTKTNLEDLSTIIQKSKLQQKNLASISLKKRAEMIKKAARYLKDNSEVFAKEISKHNGKTETEAFITEVFPTIINFEYAANSGLKKLKNKKVPLKALPIVESYIEHSPVGVVGVISPWNYPFILALQDFPYAFMAGNTSVIKPSEFSFGVGKLMEDFFLKTSLSDFVTVIYGEGDLGKNLISSGIAHISFIGSVPTGRKVYTEAARNFITCHLELGGKDPAIILNDADLENTPRQILWGAFANLGQTCAGIEKVFVHKDCYSKFLNKIKEDFKLIPDDNFGRMNVELQSTIVKRQFDDALSKGANIICERQFKGIKGAILDNVPRDSLLWTEETFGPLLAIAKFESIDEVIQEINSSNFGLTASVWSENLRYAKNIASRIESATVTINDHMITPGLPEAPWAGHKFSGLGSSKGDHGFTHFCKEKYIYNDRKLLKFKFWQFPYKKKKVFWIKNFLETQIGETFIHKLLAYIKIIPTFLFPYEYQLKKETHKGDSAR